MSITSSLRTRSTSLEALTTTDALESLRAEWERLWRRARATPFQAPAWLLPWWKHVGCGQLASLAVRDADDGELVGFAPLYIFRDDRGLRHLFPLGIATTDRIDALADPGRENEIARAIAEHVAGIRDQWDVLEWPQLAQNAVLLRCRWPATWRVGSKRCEANPVLALPARLPESMAKNLAYCRRRVAREQASRIETADASNTHALLDALAALHAKRWARRDMPGVLREPGVLAGHREAVPQLLVQGLLRLFGLRLGERIVGVVFALADAPVVPQRRWYSYIGGFDPEFAAYSPGTLLIGHAIETATAEGASAFDFLRGAESYKYRWGAIDEPMFALTINP
jgi:CelD/BcsL family acetyltransferase involved in cellulose biosynthesis